MATARASSAYETVIGLEIHVQLRTRSKMFCGCSPRFGDPANTHVCPVCLGLPGSLPVLNRRAVELGLRTAAALGCRVNPRSRFARKNYFYPDLPKGYQVSQFDQPLAEHGRLEFYVAGERRGVDIVRLHLEEDAGKSVHVDEGGGVSHTRIDLNRCGVPLAEIVTAPDLRSADEAHGFLTTLRTTLLHLGVTDASMEEGSLRCDANISVRPRGNDELNPKTEVKNLNSFRFLRRALGHEERRQVEVLESGDALVQSTRLWDERRRRTVPMRDKEEAHDYRYFPEPDLVPIQFGGAEVDEILASLPELPVTRSARWSSEWGVPFDDATAIVESPARADYFEAVVTEGADAVEAANWVRGPLMRALNDRSLTIEALPVSPAALAELLASVSRGTITVSTAKSVFEKMIESGTRAGEIIATEGLEQVTDLSELQGIVDGIIGSYPEEVAAYRDGRTQVLGFLMGQVMRATRGKANPGAARDVLEERLDA